MAAQWLTTIGLLIPVAMLTVAGEWMLAAMHGEDEITCQQASLPAALADLPEASGVAASRGTSNLIWALNDSGSPTLFGLDRDGNRRTRLEVTGAAITDWEDVSTGPCPHGSCVYIADIGDNDEQRDRITLYRVPEPSAGDRATAPVETFEARYPDRPHDAEASFVTPDGTVYVLTKEAPVSTLFRLPALHTREVLTLQRVALIPVANVTDADASRDGTWIAVRNANEVVFYRLRELLGGDVEHGTVVNLSDFDEAQGEGITIADDGTVYLAGEGGHENTPGTLLELRCTLPSAPTSR